MFERLPLRPDGLRDYRFIAMNSTMQAMFGIPDLSGQSIRDNFPDEVEDWYDDYDRVLETGEAIRFERASEPQGMVLEMFVTRVEDGSGQRLLAVMKDVTDRKHHEQRQAFLLQLGDALRSLSDAVEIHAAATRIAMNFYRADRCYYCEIVDGNSIIRQDATCEGLPSVAGVYPLSSFPIFKAVIDAGHPFVVEDAHTTDLLDEALRQLCCELQVISFIDVPVIKEGEPVGILCIIQTTPRNWTAFETELAQETAERVWAAVERARAETLIADDLRDTQRLHDLSTRLITETNIQVFYDEILATAIELTHADAGTVQILDATTQELVILASQGIDRLILDHFARVSVSSDTFCGMAFARGERAIVDFNVSEDEDPDGSLRMHAEAGYISAQSTSLMSRSGRLIGMMSTHWRKPYQPSDRELQFLDLLARQAADLIEQRQAEQKLREQAALLDIATDAIWVCNLENTILYWNQGAERLYGWQAEEALGQKVNELLSIHPAEMAEIIQTVLKQGEWYGEIRRVTKAGNPVTVQGRWTLVRDEVGQPKSMLSVDTDITEKKNLEAQFYQAQRLESLGTLTSGIAHDLNNALTPVLSLAQLLRVQKTKLDGRSQEMLQLLEDSAKRATNTVQQILTFIRGTGGKRTPVDVASLVQEVVNVAQQTFPKFITVRATIPAQGLRRVSADATQLHQVLMNLCVNARDAMPTGGMLTLSTENFDANEIFAQMNLDAQVGPYVLITVADTGTGITPQVRDRIFAPFFTTKALGQGTGLGLSTLLGIVRSYGGFIQVATEVGKGTQFKVFLPAIDTDAASHLQETALPQGQGELILVIDDEAPILQSTRAILETHHYQVLTASNGAEAISTYAQHQHEIALVLVDMMMLDMDGVTVIRMLQKLNPQVQAISVSGLLPQYQNSLEALGIKTHLNKPYTTEDLLTSIHLQLHPEA